MNLVIYEAVFFLPIFLMGDNGLQKTQVCSLDEEKRHV